MMIQFATSEALQTAHTAFEGNNFKFDFYKDLKIIKFFTREALANAIFQIETFGLKNNKDFQITGLHFDYDTRSAYSSVRS
jgi:hypothetical protein